MSVNGVMMQYFHWYIKPDGLFWQEVEKNAQSLGNAGITALWLPPAYKGLSGTYDVGYGVYDLYDLGEFNQKGTTKTKYGSKEEYLRAIQTLQKYGVQVYGDAVLNHCMGADNTEIAKATPFWQDNRLNPKGWMRDIKAYTNFTFPGRKGKYSSFEWHWWHFDGVDWDDYTKESNTVYLFEGKQFDDYVALEKGNFDYLMGCDLDFQHEEVRNEIMNWGKWYLDTTKVDGFRIDAIKHISSWFFPLWIEELEKHAQKDLFMVGEYWRNDLGTLQWYIDSLRGQMSVFDVPLHYNFHYASRIGSSYDMRNILRGTLMETNPTHAVTIVDNHDSQPLQALESPVEAWFKPLAYALILLRQEGYPCIFYADYYGAEYEDRGGDGNTYKIVLPSHQYLIDIFLKARRDYAYGDQYTYFDNYNTIGWTRIGDEQHPQGMAVIMSNGGAGYKWMEVAKPNAKFIDLTNHIKEPIYTNQWGWAEFRCNGGSVSVWVQE